jgi:3-hydroxyacyl-CoA dehydrogenase/3a,7a,12a-trihydroxy-5b-cholest-24-enoyl-CoA hydratase
LKPGSAGRIQFKLTDPASEWLVDLGKGTVERGGGQANAVLTMSEETLLALAQGASAGALFQRGKLRVDGDVTIAHRLDFLAS